MNDLDELYAKAQAAQAAGTEEQERVYHVHVSADGTPRWHVHSSTIKTLAQSAFCEALENFLANWPPMPRETW